LRARALAVDLAAIRQESGRYQPASLHQLPRARVSRRFAVDMTFTLEQELRDEEGRVLYPKGYTFNPLEYVSLSGGLVVIDGSDAEQVAWFKASPYHGTSGRSCCSPAATPRIWRQPWSGRSSTSPR
jgi:hypothetical protein